MKKRVVLQVGAALFLGGCGDTSLAPSNHSTTTGDVADSGSTTAIEGSDGGGWAVDPSWERWELRADDYLVPDAETTYVCFSSSITVTEPTHVVAFEPVVDQGAVVHHMLLYRSLEPVDRLEPCYPGPPSSVVVWGWGPGGLPLALPPEAGFPAGREPGQVHYTLQVHYENQGGLRGVVDRSGINIYSTTELRAEDASITAVGDVASVVIPPGQAEWPSAHYCGSQSTAALLDEPVTVFGSWLHAHQLGRALWTEHYRDGRRLGDLGRQDPYDFGNQRFEPLDTELRPGDELRTFCIYDSTGETEPVHGGGGTNDEMCLNYLLYYPVQPWFGACND